MHFFSLPRFTVKLLPSELKCYFKDTAFHPVKLCSLTTLCCIIFAFSLCGTVSCKSGICWLRFPCIKGGEEKKKSQRYIRLHSLNADIRHLYTREEQPCCNAVNRNEGLNNRRWLKWCLFSTWYQTHLFQRIILSPSYQIWVGEKKHALIKCNALHIWYHCLNCLK